MEYWDESWLNDANECSTSHFLRFIIYRERCVRGAEHRKRLRVLIEATWQLYLDMSPLQTHLCFQQAVAESWMFLNQTPPPVFEPDDNIYKRFIRKMRETMIAREKRQSVAKQQKQKWKDELEQFLLNECGND